MSIDDEWARVAQNPDNMLVSDSLRGRIEKLMSSDEGNAQLIPIAVIISSDDTIQMDLLRVEQNAKGWTIVGNAHISTGIKAACASRGSWKTAAILESETREVWSKELAGCDVTVGVDFHAEISTSTITIGCTPLNVQKQVL